MTTPSVTGQEVPDCAGCEKPILMWEDGAPSHWKYWFDTTEDGRPFHWKCRDKVHEPKAEV